MSFPVANVNISTDTFSVWVTRTNQLLDALSKYTVTVDNAGSNVTVGSGYVTGTFGGNTIVATQGIRGGNTSVSSNLTLISNTTVLGILRANSSVIVSNTLNVGGTATLSANLSVQGNTNISNTLNVTGNTNIGGDLVVSGNTNVLGSISFTGSNLVFSSNVTFTNTAAIIANGSFGSNGTVLTSNGTGMYWNLPVDSTNATTITSGTLNTARLPSTANISTAINIGSNVNLTTSTINVGNSTVNVSINSTSITVTSDPLVQQSDIGTDPNQIPLNQYLGTLAYQSDTIAVSNVFAIGNAGYFAANGNLGIGNTTPDYKLTVYGDISLSGGIHANGSIGTAGQILTSNGTVSYWDDPSSGGATLISNNTSTQTFYFPMSNTTSGSWSNGVVSNTKLYFVPSTGTLNSTIFNSLSDQSEKTNIETIEFGLEKILKLRGVEFDWKQNDNKSAGVIAQEIEKTLPHLVVTDKNGFKSVNYNGIIAYLIEAIKDLNNKLENKNG